MDSLMALAATSLLPSSVTSCAWHQGSSWPACLQPDALHPYSHVMGERSGHSVVDKALAHGVTDVRNLLGIPCSCCLSPCSLHYHKSFKLDALPSWAWQIQHSRWNHRWRWHSTALSEGCPAHAVGAGCFWKQRNKSRSPALLSWFGFQHKKRPSKKFRCFWLVISSFPLLNHFFRQTVEMLPTYKESLGRRNVSDQAASWSVEGLRSKSLWSSRSANSVSRRETN